MNQSSKPKIALTMGDPAGIGPEICIKALMDPRVTECCRPVIYGDSSVLRKAAKTCRLGIPAPEFINHMNICDAETITFGKIQSDAGKAAYSYIEAAVQDALAGRISAIATAPIHKEALKLAGIKHPGHTEILASLCRSDHVCMMMASEEIIVSLATIHISISDVPQMLTLANVRKAIELTISMLHSLGKPKPRIVVCGLNPHAGEGGMFGDEEERIIRPAIESAEKNGAVVRGPIPPDTAFVSALIKETDAYIVMYHDQGLIPFKMLAFNTGVNITLGLPVIRTSVDHGTAFNIAGQNQASPESLIQSILWASRLSKTRSAV